MTDAVTIADEPPGSEPGAGAARDAVEKPVRRGLLPEVMAQVDEGPLQLRPPDCSNRSPSPAAPSPESATAPLQPAG